MKQSAVVLIAIGIGAVPGPANALTQHFTSDTSLEFLQEQVEITKDSWERIAAFAEVIKTKCHPEATRTIILSAVFDEPAGTSLAAATTRVANTKGQLQRLELPRAWYFENVEPALGDGVNGVSPPRRKQPAANVVLIEVLCHPH